MLDKILTKERKALLKEVFEFIMHWTVVFCLYWLMTIPHHN